MENPFSFLGIELSNGLIRPSTQARSRLLSSLDEQFAASSKAFVGARSGKGLDRAHTLVATLKRVDGIVQGWGKHYRFCNDGAVFRHLD